jgi:SHS2 domain-containing protein
MLILFPRSAWEHTCATLCVVGGKYPRPTSRTRSVLRAGSHAERGNEVVTGELENSPYMSTILGMYEIFEHTADLGIRVRAGSLNELFADAARGLFAVMVANLDAVRMVEEVRFQIAGENCEELLHDWLAELLYTFHARRLVLAEFDVQVAEKMGTGTSRDAQLPASGGRGSEPVPNFSVGLTAMARGEPIDPSRHEIDDEVKAITWHALKVEQDAEGWLAEVIVDV